MEIDCILVFRFSEKLNAELLELLLLTYVVR